MDKMVPALDIEEILDTRPWEGGSLTPEDMETLEDGLEFLELAKRGQNIAKPGYELGVINGDLSALRTFDLLSDAGRSSEFEIDIDPDVIDDSISILSDLIINETLPNDAETERKIDLTRELFLALVDFGIALLA